MKLLLSKGAEVDSRDNVSTYNNVMYYVIKPGAHRPVAGTPGFLELFLSVNICMHVCLTLFVYT